MLRIDDLPGSLGCIVLGAPGNPLLDEVDIKVQKGVTTFRHGRSLPLVRRNHDHDFAQVWLARNDSRLAAVTLLQKGAMAGHDETTHCLCRLMAALTIELKDPADMTRVADFLRLRRLLRR